MSTFSPPLNKKGSPLCIVFIEFKLVADVGFEPSPPVGRYEPNELELRSLKL